MRLRVASSGDADLIAALGQQFVRFAEVECAASPLYRALATGIAQDPALLALAAEGRYGPIPNLFLAAVHDLVLTGVQHPLAAFYPSVHPGPAPAADPTPAFRAFCRDFAGPLRERLTTRRVQTNEVARCAMLLPAFALIAQGMAAPSLAIVEVGTSAGLLLHWDRYSYDYGLGRRYGAERALEIRCELRGEITPPLSVKLPEITARAGIDLAPIDVRYPEEARWLEALMWPDQPERRARLRQAIAIARGRPATLVAGDALEVLPDVLGGLPAESLTCLFHAHTLNQFHPDDRRRYLDLLAAHSRRREVCDLSLEYTGGDAPRMELRRFRRGEMVEHLLLATYDAHGRWLEWRLPAGGASATDVPNHAPRSLR